MNQNIINVGLFTVLYLCFILRETGGTFNYGENMLRESVIFGPRPEIDAIDVPLIQ